MKWLLLILMTLTCFTLPSKPRPVCQCEEVRTPLCAAYWRSEAVFVGQLRDITPRSQSIRRPPCSTSSSSNPFVA